MNTFFRLPATLATTGKELDTFNALPAGEQKTYRAQVVDLLAASLHAHVVYERANAEARERARQSRTEAAAAKVTALAQYLRTLDLATTEGRLRLFVACGCQIAFNDKWGSPMGGAFTDVETTLKAARAHKVSRFTVQTPTLSLWTAAPEVLAALSEKLGLPKTLAVTRPNGLHMAVFSAALADKTPDFQSPALRVARRFEMVPEDVFGEIVLDARTGLLPALPEKIARWTTLGERSFYELVNQ